MKKHYYISTLVFYFYTIIGFGQTPSFHDTKGELSISNSGTANYTIPIALPPSINNLAPSINLTYNSGSRGGIAGQGWSISTISSITRMSTRRDIDGFVDGVDFDNNDKLALDGQRLILKSGTYWANGSTYETEFKSNLKIELSIETAPGFGPQTYFIVTNPNGSRTWYGSTGNGVFQNATSLNAWYIVRHLDLYGNYITYNYSSYTFANTNQLYIDNIKFSGNEGQGLAQINEIKFNYRANNAARIERDFIKGQAVFAFKILETISVNTDDTNFRFYKLTHEVDSFGYERVSQIQEYNASREPANPIIFTYGNSPISPSYNLKHYPNGFNFPVVKLSGDFDGDGRMDLADNNSVYCDLLENNNYASAISLPFTVQPKLTFVANTKLNNKINQSQSIVNTTANIDNFVFNVHNINGVGGYAKSFPIVNNMVHDTSLDQLIEGHWPNSQGSFNGCTPVNIPNIWAFNDFYEGDFNGDGISEVLVERKTNETYFFLTERSYNQPYAYSCTIETVDVLSHYLFNLSQDGATALGSKDAVRLTDNYSLQGDRKIVADFNGDGKSDFLVMNGNTYKVVSFKQLTQSPWVELEVLGSGILSSFSTEKQIMLGDYNGDGKTDIMMPVCLNCNDWEIYYSNQNPNGGEFFKAETQYNVLKYEPISTGDTHNGYSYYYAMDINKDGKTDILRVKTSKEDTPAWIEAGFKTYYVIEAYFNNIGVNGASFTKFYDSGAIRNDSDYMVDVIVGDYRSGGLDSDLILYKHDDKNLYCYKFEKDIQKDNRLSTVSEANGKIVHSITYSPMVPGTVYSTTNQENYPNVEIAKIPTTALVSKLTLTVNNVAKHQDFKYHGYVSNFNYGAIGFKRTARSSWYLQPADAKIWTIEENDMSKRGATTKTWTSTNGASVFATTPTDLLSTKTNTFKTHTFASGVYNVLLEKQVTIDVLTGVKIEKSFSYDDVLYGVVDAVGANGFQTSCLTKYFNGTVLNGSSTTGTDLADYKTSTAGVGAAYYIGRPEKVKTSNTIINSDGTTDTRTSEEKFTYLNGNIIKTEKKGHNTDYLVEDMTYDAVGNLLTKKVSMPTAIPAIASRTITDEYEPTKRFVKKKIDHQGFINLLEYNNYGQVKKSTNYLGVVTNIVYDNWGKPTSATTIGVATTPLVTTTSYLKLTDGGHTVTTHNSTGDNAKSITQYDVLGRVVKTTTKGFALNSEISKSIAYDALGRKVYETEPYSGALSSVVKRTIIDTYDYLHRPTKIITATGRIQTLFYSGLTSTSIDDGKTTTATVDAMGNKVQTTDLGGIINFSYFANGALMKTNYEGNIISFTIDGWGNKTSTTDPNAGTYTYSYDAFGQPITETTPKGTTTYSYDNFGKLSTKKVIGDGANFNTSYTYNAFSQLKKEVSTTSANVAIDSFENFYDSLNRLEKTEEKNANFDHSKTITFDTFGRLATETNYTLAKSTFANSFSDNVVTKYVYNAYNGIMDKMTDAGNNTIWQLNTANDKMQALTATLGNGILVTNTYDDFGYAKTQQHKKGTTFVVNNTYEFDAVKGNLKKRQNTAPGMIISEVFTYDDQDRLLTWTNPLGVVGALDSNVYDAKGRITTNNKLGVVNYNSNLTTGIYKKDHVVLNTTGQAYYTALAGNQIVNYTMFKSPISISESGKGKINFEYNSHLSRTKQLYHNVAIAPSTVKSQRKTKLYTDDGSTEIIMDTQANTVKIITFVGGDAYAAVQYSEKLVNKTTGVITNSKFYLHRDYQGTIIAVSNSLGVAVEKRAFDAWGNLVKLVNSANASLSLTNGLLAIDRGYTGHEHLNEVRLIHMNGRLYDPVLRSFLMPDNFVQQPENTQNYNRYAYVLNNPLKYTDPSGEIFLGPALLFALNPIGAYVINVLTNGGSLDWKAAAKVYAISAITALATYGIGSASSALFSNWYSQATFQALSHATIQGISSELNGGEFWRGALVGAVSSIAASAYSGGMSLDGAGNPIAGTGFNSIGDNLGGAGMIAFGTLAGGASAKLSGGNFWQGAVTGLIVSGLNHAAHAMMQPKTTVAGIYGAGGEGASGNPELKALVEGQGGKMFTSSTPIDSINGDDEIIAYLKDGFDKGNSLEIYGHSRGGAAAVRIANKLGAMHINVNQITLYDPVGFYGGGSFNFDYPNVMSVTNYYQRNPVDGVAWWANNPFQGSPVSGSFQWPAIRNVNYTGNLSINHINITGYAIKNP